jgi:hypothetical protein
MEENKLYVGQKIYINNKDKSITEATIERIGKKYFYLEGGYSKHPIDKKTLEYTNKMYCQHNFSVYLNTQDILDKHEKQILLDKLRKCFEWNGKAKYLDLEKLRKIAEILEI